MANYSYTRPWDLTCAGCRQPFSTDIQLIVDMAHEKLDLYKQNRLLRQTHCPYCGHIVEIDSPLLIYRLNEAIKLIFSPCQRTSSAQDQEHLSELKAMLLEKLGDNGPRELRDGSKLPLIPRAYLTNILSALVNPVREQDRTAGSLAEVREAAAPYHGRAEWSHQVEKLSGGGIKQPQLFGDAVRSYVNALDVSIDRIAPFAGFHPEQLRRLGKDEKHSTFLKPDAISRLVEAAALVGKPLPAEKKEVWELYLKVASLYTVFVVAAHRRTQKIWPQKPEDYDVIWEKAKELVLFSGAILYAMEEGEEYKNRVAGGFYGDSSFLHWKWSEQLLESEEDIALALEEIDKKLEELDKE